MKAMLLAAGLGTRMRPLTETTAKPLLALRGRSLLDHALDRLAEAGVDTVVVNAHWHADRVAEHLARRSLPRTILRREDALLDTGGSVRAALGLLGPDPFFVVNGDSFWLDGPGSALARMLHAWDGQADAILLVQRGFQVLAEIGAGDFALDPWGRLRRPEEHEIVPYVYAGVQLVTPALFDNAPEGRFSMNLLWDRAMRAGRLRGLVHDGPWFHLSTPSDLAEAESQLLARMVPEARG
jgi:N-acetyl-alpha-D-muramate 1-phosphate uridylyltransferase